MKSLLLVSLYSMLIPLVSFSQVRPLVGTSVGFGLSNQTITVGNNTSDYSMASMLSMNLGVSMPITGGFEAQMIGGYFLHFGATRTSVNGNTSTSSESFNIKRVSLGASQKFKFKEKNSSFHLTAGLDFNFPGSLNVKLNDSELGRVEYEGSTGLYFGPGIGFMASKSTEMVIGLRYRKAQFNAEDWENGEISLLNQELRDLRADNIELTLLVLFGKKDG